MYTHVLITALKLRWQATSIGQSKVKPAIRMTTMHTPATQHQLTLYIHVECISIQNPPMNSILSGDHFARGMYMWRAQVYCTQIIRQLTMSTCILATCISNLHPKTIHSLSQVMNIQLECATNTIQPPIYIIHKLVMWHKQQVCK